MPMRLVTFNSIQDRLLSIVLSMSSGGLLSILSKINSEGETVGQGIMTQSFNSIQDQQRGLPTSNRSTYLGLSILSKINGQMIRFTLSIANALAFNSIQDQRNVYVTLNVT